MLGYQAIPVPNRSDHDARSEPIRPSRRRRRCSRKKSGTTDRTRNRTSSSRVEGSNPYSSNKKQAMCSSLDQYAEYHANDDAGDDAVHNDDDGDGDDDDDDCDQEEDSSG